MKSAARALNDFSMMINFLMFCRLWAAIRFLDARWRQPIGQLIEVGHPLNFADDSDILGAIHLESPEIFVASEALEFVGILCFREVGSQ